MGVPPHFHPKISVSKMTYNGLKCILNTSLKKLKFGRILTPPPLKLKNFNFLVFIFFEGFPNSTNNECVRLREALKQ